MTTGCRCWRAKQRRAEKGRYRGLVAQQRPRLSESWAHTGVLHVVMRYAQPPNSMQHQPPPGKLPMASALSGQSPRRRIGGHRLRPESQKLSRLRRCVEPAYCFPGVFCSDHPLRNYDSLPLSCKALLSSSLPPLVVVIDSLTCPSPPIPPCLHQERRCARRPTGSCRSRPASELSPFGRRYRRALQ